MRLLALALIICRVKALMFNRRFNRPTEAFSLRREVGAIYRYKKKKKKHEFFFTRFTINIIGTN